MKTKLYKEPLTNYNMKHKIQRQGLRISIGKLLKLANKLRKEQRNLLIELDQPIVIDYSQKYLVGIINEKGLSDTWELE